MDGIHLSVFLLIFDLQMKKINLMYSIGHFEGSDTMNPRKWKWLEITLSLDISIHFPPISTFLVPCRILLLLSVWRCSQALWLSSGICNFLPVDHFPDCIVCKAVCPPCSEVSFGTCYYKMMRNTCFMASCSSLQSIPMFSCRSWERKCITDILSVGVYFLSVSLIPQFQ